jgi:retron-type reverse transcriptase
MALYIERWLKAPVQEEDGQLVLREKGTPQGGVISPLLANLFLHYAFDRWMAERYPQVPFERYAMMHRALQNGSRSSGGSGSHSRALTGMRVGTSSGEDENRLLQGW